MADEPKLSPVETFKLDSGYLRGTIAEELDGSEDSFGKASIQLLKHHGTYQQDDRDARTAGRVDGHKGKAPKAYSFMVRTRVPGGKLTSDQLLAELDLCDEVGNATLRVTSRQGLQLHGVLKHDLQKTIRRINEVQLTTLAACGDVERNVMCCPAPYKHNPVRSQLQDLADGLAAHLAPRSRAYHEIWLTDLETGEESWSAGGPLAERTSSRSTVRRTCRANLKPRSVCRLTIASTCMPTIWDCWRLSKVETAASGSSATTCWLAAEWA